MKNADAKSLGPQLQATTPAFDLAGWGMPLVAYVRHVGEEGAGGWAIHAADGTVIGAAPDRLTAIMAVRQHDLEPMSLH